MLGNTDVRLRMNRKSTSKAIEKVWRVISQPETSAFVWLVAEQKTCFANYLLSQTFGVVPIIYGFVYCEFTSLQTHIKAACYRF